jgi:hypothetical protein
MNTVLSIPNGEFIMELQSARHIIDTLAQGVHPVTGEMMAEDSPYNAPPVIRALFAVSCALDQRPAAKPRRASPPNSGKAWSPEEDGQLTDRFAQGMELAQIAQAGGRSVLAVQARLIKLGKLAPSEGVPLGARFS